MKRLILILSLVSAQLLSAQDTTIVQTLAFDSTGRNYMFTFPGDTSISYERIVMEYRMRCKDGLVSTSLDRNKGCGEWDYSCNTYITDSSYTDSVQSTHPSHIISTFSGSAFNYTTIPTNNYYQYIQKSVTYTDTTSETTATIGGGSSNINHPFGTSDEVSKTQYLWTATELASAGLTANDITGLRLNISTNATEARYVRIRLKNSIQTTLNASTPELTGFTEVYFLNTALSNGLNDFKFYNNFTWNGTSNIIVEVSFTNSAIGTDNIVIGHDAGSNMGLISSGHDYSLNFTGSEHLNLPPASFGSISNEISISLWCYGNPDLMPLNTTIFEAIDNANQRQAQSHLPWSNSRVYWDCGYQGGYDRIDNAALNTDFSGQWNHWAFTKNAATGNMKIYLNGSLWHSGSGKNRPIDIKKFIVGASHDLGRYYYGKIDEFRVWDTELSLSEISDWMYKTVDNTHPSYTNLVALYGLNEGNGTTTNDASINTEIAPINGLANWEYLRGVNLFKHFTETTFRPNLTFVQGVYTTVVNDSLLIDTVQNGLSSVIAYQVVGTDIGVIDTQYVYASGYEYLYDENGATIDSFPISTTGIINISTLDYYKKYSSNFEIMSFVTPYGIGLNFGMEGKMWSFDVSDFGPILKGRKRLYMDKGGQNQEQMDIRFLFIEGTPPRDVMNIQQIWRVQAQGYSNIISDTRFEPRDVTLNPSANAYKIRTAITGHGQQGEFIPRNHFINIDGGTKELEWQAWKKCGDNPVYPQGGTWIFDRAGWCPGAATDVQELMINANPGQTVEVDYGVQTASGDSRYIVNNQLVTYGSPNHTLDARLVEVQRPSMRDEYVRINPACQDPIVVIQNTGSANLTSCDLQYSVDGGTTETFAWSGNLAFLEMDTVILPIANLNFWSTTSSKNEFIASVTNPNGGSDEYTNNNSYTSTFDSVFFYNQGSMTVIFRSNKKSGQNTYTVTDMNGSVIFSRYFYDMNDNTKYEDEITLQEGCYRIYLDDTGNDGLDFWYYNSYDNDSDGYGYLKLKDQFGEYIRAFDDYFNDDFGSFISYDFVVTDIIQSVSENKYKLVSVSPNPANEVLNVELHGYQNQDISLHIYDAFGRLVLTKNVNSLSNILNHSLNISSFESGTYLLKIQSDNEVKTKKFIKL